MNVRARIDRFERRLPPGLLTESETDRWYRYMRDDGESLDLVIRISQDRKKRFAGLDSEAFAAAQAADPLQSALLARLEARKNELLAGAKPSDDGPQRHRWRIEGVLPPGIVLP